MRRDTQRRRDHRRAGMALAIDVVEIESVDQAGLDEGGGSRIGRAIGADDRHVSTRPNIAKKAIQDAGDRQAIATKQAAQRIQKAIVRHPDHVRRKIGQGFAGDVVSQDHCCGLLHGISRFSLSVEHRVAGIFRSHSNGDLRRFLDSARGRRDPIFRKRPN